MSAKCCIGFGEQEGVCKGVALVAPFLWCNDCERERREAITARWHRYRPRPRMRGLVTVEDPRLVFGARARRRAVPEATSSSPCARVPLEATCVRWINDVPVHGAR